MRAVDADGARDQAEREEITMNRMYGALIALILLLTACGSTESSFRDQLAELGFEDETADCLIEELDARGLGIEDVTDDATADGMPAGAEEAMDACLRTALDDLTDDDGADDDDVARIVEDDAVDADDDDADADADDDGDIMTRPLTLLEQAFVDGAMEEGASEDAARCVLGEFNDRGIDMLDLATLGEDEMPDDLLSAMFACGDELIESGAFDFTDTEGVDDYGDDAELDALHDACTAGDSEACDELYWQSPFGSGYEAYGATCGNTAPQGSDCTAGSDGGSDAVDDYGSDAELDALYDACTAGNGEACDELFWTSPVDSAYEAYGDTCGGRFEPGTVFCGDEL
jgi:hypothetical protein